MRCRILYMKMWKCCVYKPPYNLQCSKLFQLSDHPIYILYFPTTLPRRWFCNMSTSSSKPYPYLATTDYAGKENTYPQPE